MPLSDNLDQTRTGWLGGSPESIEVGQSVLSRTYLTLLVCISPAQTCFKFYYQLKMSTEIIRKILVLK